MTGRHTLPPLSLLTAALLGAAALPAAARDGAGEVSLQAIWNDPAFQKQFVAGYGINPEIEPRVTPEEVKLLEEIRPLMADDLKKAEATLRKKMKPDSSAILDVTLGMMLYQQGQMKEALASYLKAVQKFPSFRRAWRNLGLLHAQEGRYLDAIRSFTKMIELGGGDAYSYGLLGVAYAARQDWQPAEVAYRNALLLQPDNQQWRLGLTGCVFKEGKFEDAASLLDVLIERYPDNADFWMLQAQSYLSMNQPLKAAENLEAIDRLGRSKSDGLYTLGDIYVREGLPDLATRAWQRAIDIDPTQKAERAAQRCEALAAHGAPDQARWLANHVRDVLGPQMTGPDRGRLLKLEARLSMAEGDDSPETAATLEAIVQLDPLDGDALLLLGQHWSRMSEPDRAILYYERAENLPAFEANAKIRHAQVLVGLGRYNDALPLLRSAQSQKPREDVARYLEQVERLARARR